MWKTKEIHKNVESMSENSELYWKSYYFTMHVKCSTSLSNHKAMSNVQQRKELLQTCTILTILHRLNTPLRAANRCVEADVGVVLLTVLRGERKVKSCCDTTRLGCSLLSARVRGVFGDAGDSPPHAERRKQLITTRKHRYKPAQVTPGLLPINIQS